MTYQETQCHVCGGAGQAIQEITVTTDMAIDAGDRTLAGHTYHDYQQCYACLGSGLLTYEMPDPPEPEPVISGFKSIQIGERTSGTREIVSTHDRMEAQWQTGNGQSTSSR